MNGRPGTGLSIVDIPETNWEIFPAEGVMRHPRRTPWKAKCGYLYFDERVAGLKRKGLVHRAIWESVHGRLVGRQIVNHKDGNKLNNAIENLEISNYRHNNYHAARMGLSAKGEMAGNAKLTEAQVIEIHASNGTQDEIAARFGVTRGCVKEIWACRTWRHLGLARRSRARPRACHAKTLTEKIVIEARRQIRMGRMAPEVAEELGVSASTLAKAISGYSWGHIPGAIRYDL